MALESISSLINSVGSYNMVSQYGLGPVFYLVYREWQNPGSTVLSLDPVLASSLTAELRKLPMDAPTGTVATAIGASFSYSMITAQVLGANPNDPNANPTFLTESGWSGYKLQNLTPADQMPGPNGIGTIAGGPTWDTYYKDSYFVFTRYPHDIRTTLSENFYVHKFAFNGDVMIDLGESFIPDNNYVSKQNVVMYYNMVTGQGPEALYHSLTSNPNADATDTLRQFFKAVTELKLDSTQGLYAKLSPLLSSASVGAQYKAVIQEFQFTVTPDPMTPATTEQMLAGLYVGFYHRAPDKQGLDYWVDKFAHGSSLKDVSALFATHPRFSEEYGGLTNNAFVQKVYINMLGNGGDAEGITYWTNMLNSGTSKSDFIASFIPAAMNANLAQSLANGSLSITDYNAAVIRQNSLINKSNTGLEFVKQLGVKSNPGAASDSDPAYRAAQVVIANVTDTAASKTAAFDKIHAATSPEQVLSQFGVQLVGVSQFAESFGV